MCLPNCDLRNDWAFYILSSPESSFAGTFSFRLVGPNPRTVLFSVAGIIIIVDYDRSVPAKAAYKPIVSEYETPHQRNAPPPGTEPVPRLTIFAAPQIHIPEVSLPPMFEFCFRVAHYLFNLQRVRLKTERVHLPKVANIIYHTATRQYPVLILKIRVFAIAFALPFNGAVCAVCATLVCTSDMILLLKFFPSHNQCPFLRRRSPMMYPRRLPVMYPMRYGNAIGQHKEHATKGVSHPIGSNTNL